MPEIKIKIENKIAKPLNNCVICDNSDYTVKFIFDEEWEKEPLRIARFIWNKQYVDVQFTGDTCEVPLVSKTNNLAIGVYAGDLRTTTPAILVCHMSILSEDVIEHSVTPSEYEEIMKLLNAQATDIAALKAVDKRIWTNLDTINKTASAAKVKAEEGVAKADNALANSEANKADIETLYDEKNTIASRLTETENTLNNVKTTAETAKTKAEEALARNVFTDEEKAKLAGITNPMIIKGRVDTVEDLPTIAEIGWFYFVGLESASSYQEYCYSETGWEYVGVSQEGVDLSNYYTKAQVDSKNQTLEGKIQGNTAAIASLNKDVGDSVAGIYTEITSVKNKISPLESNVNTLIDEKNIIASRLTEVENTLSSVKTTAETAETKADNALTQADSNTAEINALKTNVNALKAVDERIWTNLDTINKTASAAKTKAEEGVAKADNALTATRTNATNITNLQTDVTDLIDEKNIMGSRLTEAENTLSSVKTTTETNVSDIAVNKSAIAVNKSALGYQRKNLLPYPKSIVKGGITFTCDENGYMTGSNTTSDTRQWTSASAQYSMYLEAGTYYFSSFAETVCTNSDGRAYIIANGTQIVGVSTRETHVEKMFTLSEATTIYVMAKVYDGKVAFMIREADITDDSYEPYKPSLFERCLLKDTAGINLGAVTQSGSITIDNLSSYTALWINVSGAVAGISFMTNLIVPVAYLAKSTSNRVQLAGGIPSSAYITSEGPLAAKNMSGYITAKVSGNTLDLTISDGTIGSIEVVSLM